MKFNKQKFREKLIQLKPDPKFLLNLFLCLITFLSLLKYLEVLTYTDKIHRTMDLKPLCRSALDKETKNIYVYEFKNAYEKGKIYCTYTDSRLNRMVYIRKIDGNWVSGGQINIGNGFIWPYLF